MNIRFIKNKSKNLSNVNRRHIKGQKVKCTILGILCLIFLAGVLCGSLYLNNSLNDDYFTENSDNLVNILIDNDLDNEKIFLELLSSNIVMLLFMWIIGLSILGAPILIFFVAYDGFSLGVTISYILNVFRLI